MNYDELKLENQLCFPLYVASKEVIKKYKKHLEELDLTYTQYITMMILWEVKHINVKELGEKIFLDSGTLTPLLKKLEKKGYITREKLESDERNLIISITEEGMDLREKARKIPYAVSEGVCIEKEEAIALYNVLYKIINQMK